MAHDALRLAIPVGPRAAGRGRGHGGATAMTLAPADVAAKYRKDRKPDCEF
jgi:hypothetical protein